MDVFLRLFLHCHACGLVVRRHVFHHHLCKREVIDLTEEGDTDRDTDVTMESDEES
jgi:hypothetical protein